MACAPQLAMIWRNAWALDSRPSFNMGLTRVYSCSQAATGIRARAGTPCLSGVKSQVTMVS